ARPRAPPRGTRAHPARRGRPGLRPPDRRRRPRPRAALAGERLPRPIRPPRHGAGPAGLGNGPGPMSLRLAQTARGLAANTSLALAGDVVAKGGMFAAL